MGTVTSRRTDPGSNIGAVIRCESEVRIDLEIMLRALAGEVLSKIKASDAKLKDLATDAGRSFKETFQDKGTVSVAGRKLPKSGADEFVADQRVIAALSAAERKDLLKRGIVRLEAPSSRGYYGRVSAEPF